MATFTRGFLGRRDRDERLPPGQYDAGATWPVLTAEATPNIDVSTWTFTIAGLVDTPTTWTWDEMHALPEGRYDGAIHASPTLLQSYVVFANKTLLDAAGIALPTLDAPWTWDDFAANAKALTTGDQHGLCWGLRSAGALVMSTALNYGGTFFTTEGDTTTFTFGPAEQEIPTLQLLAASAEDLRSRAERIVAKLALSEWRTELEQSTSPVGGGSFPVMTPVFSGSAGSGAAAASC